MQVKTMLQPEQEVMVVAGIHNLHDHERLAMAVAKAMRGMSTHVTRSDTRFHAKTLTFLDGAVLREVSYCISFWFFFILQKRFHIHLLLR
jgi:hypothetical protein